MGPGATPGVPAEPTWARVNGSGEPDPGTGGPRRAQESARERPGGGCPGDPAKRPESAQGFICLRLQ
jgi:hypothetical protein